MLVERLRVAAPRDARGERTPLVVQQIDEPDVHALGGELVDELGAEPACTSADERDLAPQARVGGELRPGQPAHASAVVVTSHPVATDASIARLIRWSCRPSASG